MLTSRDREVDRRRRNARSPVQAPDERSLLRGLHAGDEAAFEKLVDAHGDQLFRVARKMLGNEEDARDAVQETFLAAWRAIGRFAGKSRLSTWLYRILVNSCLMTLRRRRKRPERLADELPRPRTTSDASVENAAAREETVKVVRDGIRRLPGSYRRILMLRAIDGVDTRDAARSLCVTPNAVKVRLYRAKRALRAELEPVFGLPMAG